jgi:hypothetical protein
MGDGDDGGNGSGVGGGSHLAPGDSIGSSHSGGPGSGTIPWSVLLLIVVVLFAIWGVLSLIR